MARVLQVVTTTQRRGAEVFATDLGAALADRGWAVDTVALEEGGPGPGRLDLPALGSRRISAGGLARLRRRARTSDVVVAHGSTSLIACAAATAATGIPYVYRSIGDPAHWAPSGVRRVRTTMLLRRAAAVVVLWPAAASILRARHHVEGARIRVIPNGVPAAGFRVAGDEERRAARAGLGLPLEGSVVATVGALTAEKRVDLAIRAVAGLPGVHLVVVGDGPLRDDLRALAGAEARGRVTFTGALADVGPVYASADALALPSTTEGVPAVLIEAALSGVPAAATDVGGVSGIVDHERTGHLVGPTGDGLGAAIGAVLRDRERLGAAARRHCLERFELAAIADRWAELLREVCG
jgi:glycosyltransferase involved in cell wall biosynthesis